MQVLVPCLIFLVVDNVQLVLNERLDAQEVLDSTQFKNAVAKVLLKKKLSNLESARQQDTLATFLKRGGNNGGLRTAPKSSFLKGDDPSRKQAQMANTFIASSNLLFGTKSQPRKCGAAKPVNKEGLDMGSLRQLSGYNEDGTDFIALKDPFKAVLPNRSVTEKKRLLPKRAALDPISCYLSEPKKVTCMHKDIIYKIALPNSEVGDDEIGRIVESIYRAVEVKNGGISSLDEPMEGNNQKASLKGLPEATGSKMASEDSMKRKRASEDYLKSVFLTNLMAANNKDALPYTGHNPVFIPLLIPMAQPKPPVGYYSGLTMDPRLQVPMNVSSVDTPMSYEPGRATLLENGYGQFLVPNGLALPELSLKQRSQANMTEEEEKRRNWLALMATNGLVPFDNKFITQTLTQPREFQRIKEEKDSITNGNRLTVAETSEVLDKLLNKRQERDTYSVSRQMKRKPSMQESPIFSSHRHVLGQVVQKLTDPGDFIVEEKKGCPCPCSTDMCASKSTRKPTKSPSKCPMKLIFQLTSSSPIPTKCSTTAGTQKCSTCPEGCQPVPSCEATTESCSTLKCCGDSDIGLRVVSDAKSNKDTESRQHLPLLPVQTSHLNWLPYSPQVPRQNEPSDHMAHFNGEKPLLGANANASTERELDDYEPANSGQMQLTDQMSNGFKPLQLEKFNEPLEYPLPSRHNGHNQILPDNSLVQNQMFNNVDQHFEQSKHTEVSSSDAMNQPGTQNAPPKHTELQSKPLPQAEHSNDIKTKKHRESFFARLRSKFHKGLPQIGADFKKLPTGGLQENQDSNHNLIQTKAMLGSSIFKFSPKNQTIGKNNSSEQLNNTALIDNQQHCVLDQTNQSNDQNQTLNQTQPSTINNINITISSMQPQPIVQGQLPNGNQTNQPQTSNRIMVQCPVIPSGTIQPSLNDQSRTCTVTKIWLCTQPSTSSPSQICETPPTTNSEAFQPSTCRTPSTTTDSGSCPIQRGLQNGNYMLQQGNMMFTDGTPVSRVGSSDAPLQNVQPQHVPLQNVQPPQHVLPQKVQSPQSNQWPAPGTYQAPQSPQMAPEGVGLGYSPLPGWNQWQYPMEKMNAPPTERANLQQPRPTLFVQPPLQKQPDPLPQILAQPGNPPWRQNYMQPQNHVAWQQPPSQQLDPRWQPMEAPNEYIQPRYNQDTGNGYRQPMKLNEPGFLPRFPNQWEARNNYGQPIKSDMQYSYIETKPYEEKKWTKSNRTAGSGRMVGMRKPHTPNIIEHIARVRRHLSKKRSRASNQHPSRKP